MGFAAYALTTVDHVKQYYGITKSEDDALIERLIESASASFQTYCNREFKVPYLIAKTIAFVDSDPDTITDSANGFEKAGFETDQALVVSGSANNDSASGDWLIPASVVTGTITLAATDELIAEAEGSTVTLVGNWIEYHDGLGRDFLVVRNPPIASIVAIHDDTDREYGSDYLLDPDDYVIDETGWTVRLDWMTFNNGIRNVRIIYEGGYRTIPADLEQACIEQTAIWYRQSRHKDLGVRSRSLPDESMVTVMVDAILPQIKRVLDDYWISVARR